MKVPPHPHPLAVPHAPRICTVCTAPLAGCASGLFCVGCGLEHVQRHRFGYLDLPPSRYYVAVAR